MIISLKNRLRKTAVTTAFSATLASAIAFSVTAQQDANTAANSEFRPACSSNTQTPAGTASVNDYAFWEGEWHVYETATGNLMGFDEIKRELAGCVLVQHWRQMNDRYSRPGAPYRFSGRSISGIRSDGKWHQLWVDTEGSHIDVKGGLNSEGQMVLESDWQTAARQDGTELKFKRVWTWAPQSDGTIHNWGVTKIEGQDDRPSYDVTYRRNAPGNAASQMIKNK